MNSAVLCLMAALVCFAIGGVFLAYVLVGRGVGVPINIDGLRQLAKRGEWGLFWSWPCMLTLVFLGMQLLCVAASMADRQLLFALAGASACVPAILIAWFMPWAAVYTEIDADIAE